MTGAIGATLDGRVQAERLMIAKCIITREDPAVPEVFDPVDGGTPAGRITVYEGKCKLRQPGPTDRASTSGGFTWTMADSVLSIPMSVTGVRLDDLVEITESPLNVEDVGMRAEIKFVPRGTFTTARRFIIREAP